MVTVYYDVITGLPHEYDHSNCYECRLSAFKELKSLIKHIKNKNNQVLPEYLVIAYGLYETSTFLRHPIKIK